MLHAGSKHSARIAQYMSNSMSSIKPPDQALTCHSPFIHLTFLTDWESIGIVTYTASYSLWKEYTQIHNSHISFGSTHQYC